MNDLQKALDAAKAALAQKDFALVRALLASQAQAKPDSTAAFLLARAAFGEGHAAEAATLLEGFQAPRPKHAGAQLLRARILIELGDIEGARKAAKAAADLNQGNVKVATRLLETIEASEASAQAKSLIETLNAAYPQARSSAITDVVRDLGRQLAQLPLGPDWGDDPVQATIAYFRNATDMDAALRNYDAHLIEISTRFGYITWPQRIQEHVRGKSILDVGCGFGGYGMGFLVAGATEYVGLDPVMRMDSTRAKNKRVRAWDDMGVTPRTIAEELPAIRLFEGIAEDLDLGEQFDTIALHNVTEHLIQLDVVFEGLVPLMRDQTKVVFLHHNFYCWNGHHFAPNQPHQINLDESPRQNTVYDWRHIEFAADMPQDHYFQTHLNRVRLDDIKAITAKHFDIDVWEELPSSKATLERLTPEILKRVRKTIPDLSERDLSVNVVFCVANKKHS